MSQSAFDSAPSSDASDSEPSAALASTAISGAEHVHSASRLRSERALTTGLGVLAVGGGYALIDGLFGSPAFNTAAVVGTACFAAWLSDWRAQRDLRIVDRVGDSVRRVRAGEEVSRIDTRGLGSLSTVGTAFNELFEAIAAATAPALSRLVGLEQLPERARATLESVRSSAEDQEGAVEEIASLMSNINTSIANINERVETLSSSAEEASASIVEMGGSVEAVAQTAAQLNGSLEESTSSVHEMGTSIREVSDGAREVLSAAEETASAMVEIDESAAEVDNHVREAAALAQAVSQGAEVGSHAVEETIGDIVRIEGLTRDARDVLEVLAGRIGEISKIVNVIDEISDETNLLSLNAAIIAAQAGESGKAFLIVANHVKTLAKRTTASTKDIEELIRSVQAESDNAVRAMGNGITAIEQGVSRSRKAGVALADIRTSADAASGRVAEIARASEEQARSAKGVSQSAQRTSMQMQQIASAIEQQRRASEQLLERQDEARQLCDHVHRSTDEQRSTGLYIRESTNAILEMIREVQRSTEQHASASQSVSEAVERLLENAQRSGENIPELQALLRDINEGAASTTNELARFQATARSF